MVNFHLSGIQMSGIQVVVQYSDHHSNTGPVFKWRSEYRTKSSPVFKWHSNNGPFGDHTTFNHLNTRLVRYSDPHCTNCPVFRCNQFSSVCYSGIQVVEISLIVECMLFKPWFECRTKSTLTIDKWSQNTSIKNINNCLCLV